MRENIEIRFFGQSSCLSALRKTQKLFQLVFLLDRHNLPTEEDLSRHGTVENVDEFLKHNDLANGINSSEEDDCYSNNEEDDGN